MFGILVAVSAFILLSLSFFAYKRYGHKVPSDQKIQSSNWISNETILNQDDSIELKRPQVDRWKLVRESLNNKELFNISSEMGVTTVIKDYGSDILEAIRENDLEKLKSIFEKELKSEHKIQKLVIADMKHRPTKKFACPLILAARQEDPRIMEYFLKKGVNPNYIHQTVYSSRRREKLTPLHISVDLGLYATVELLLLASANPNVADHNEETPLHIAVKKPDRVMARMLLSRGADPQLTDCKRNAPLHIATLYGHLQLVRLLLHHNADVFQKGQDGAIAPYIAAREGHIHLLQLFSAREISCVNIKLPCFGDKREKTPLHITAENGHREAMKALIEQFSAAIDLNDSHENTPLHCVVLNEWLPQKGMRDKDDFTACARILLKHKVSINAKNIHEESALHLAAANHYQRIVEILLALGANPYVENSNGQKPIDVTPKTDTVTQQLLKNAMHSRPRNPDLSNSMDTVRLQQILGEYSVAESETLPRELIYHSTHTSNSKRHLNKTHDTSAYMGSEADHHNVSHYSSRPHNRMSNMTTGTSINSIFEQPQQNKPNKTSTLRSGPGDAKQRGGLDISRENATQTSNLQLHDVSTGTGPAYEPLMTRPETRSERSQKSLNKQEVNKRDVEDRKKRELEEELARKQDRLLLLMKEEEEEKQKIEEKLKRLEEEREKERLRYEDTLRRRKQQEEENRRFEEEEKLRQQDEEIKRLEEEKIKRKQELERIQKEEQRIRLEQEQERLKLEQEDRERKNAKLAADKHKEKKKKKEELQKARRLNAGITEQVEEQLKQQGYKPYVDSKGRIFLLDMQGKVVLDGEGRPMNLQIASPQQQAVTIIQGVDIFDRPVFITHTGQLIATNANAQPIIDPSGKPVLASSQPLASTTIGYRPLLDQNGEQVFDADRKPLFLDANGLVILPSAGVYNGNDADSFYSADITNTSIRSFDTSITQSGEPNQQVSDAVLQTVKEYTGSTPKTPNPRNVSQPSTPPRTEAVTPLKKTKADDSIRLEYGSASPDLTPNVNLQRPSPAARKRRPEEVWTVNNPSSKAGEHINAWPQRHVSTDNRTPTGYVVTRAVSNDSTASRRSIVSESSEAETVVERQDNDVVLTVSKESSQLGFAEFIEELSSSSSSNENIKVDSDVDDEKEPYRQEQGESYFGQEYREQKKEEEKEEMLILSENLGMGLEIKGSNDLPNISADDEVRLITCQAAKFPIEERTIISPVACSSPTDDMEVREFLSRSPRGKKRIILTPESIHNLSSSSSSTAPGSNISDEKPKVYDRDIARREFFSVPPLNIESGGELSENEISRYSVFSDNPPTPPPIISQTVRAKSTSDLYVSPYARRAANRRLLLSTAVPKPYKSFGKVDVKTDALKELVTIPRSENSSTDIHKSQMDSISEVLGGDEFTFGLIIKPREDGSLIVKEESESISGAKSTPSLNFDEPRPTIPTMSLDTDFEKLLAEYKTNRGKPIQMRETQRTQRETFILEKPENIAAADQIEVEEQLTKQNEQTIPSEASRKLREKVNIASVRDKIGLYESHTAKEIQEIVTESESEVEFGDEGVLQTEEVKYKLESLGFQITELEDGSPKRRRKIEVLREQSTVKVDRPHNIDETSISLKADPSERSYDLNSSGEYQPEIPQGVTLQGLNYLETSVDDPSSMVLKKSSSSLDKVEDVIPISRSPVRSSRHSVSSELEGGSQKRSSSVPVLDESDDEVIVENVLSLRDRSQSNPYILESTEDKNKSQHWYGARNKDFVTDVDEILTVERSADEILSIKMHTDTDLDPMSLNPSQNTDRPKETDLRHMETNIDDYEESKPSYLRRETRMQDKSKSQPQDSTQTAIKDHNQGLQESKETNIDEQLGQPHAEYTSIEPKSYSGIESNIDDFNEPQRVLSSAEIDRNSNQLLESQSDKLTISETKDNSNKSNDTSSDSSLNIDERLDRLETNIDDIVQENSESLPRGENKVKQILQPVSSESGSVHETNLDDLPTTQEPVAEQRTDKTVERLGLIMTDIDEYSEEPRSGKRFTHSEQSIPKPLSRQDQQETNIDSLESNPSVQKDDSQLQQSKSHFETDLDDIPTALETGYEKSIPRHHNQEITSDDPKSSPLADSNKDNSGVLQEPKHHFETNIDDISTVFENEPRSGRRYNPPTRSMPHDKNAQKQLETNIDDFPTEISSLSELSQNLGSIPRAEKTNLIEETDKDGKYKELPEEYSKEPKSGRTAEKMKESDPSAETFVETDIDNLPQSVNEPKSIELDCLEEEQRKPFLMTDIDDQAMALSREPRSGRNPELHAADVQQRNVKSHTLETNIDDSPIEMASEPKPGSRNIIKPITDDNISEIKSRGFETNIDDLEENKLSENDKISHPSQPQTDTKMSHLETNIDDVLTCKPDEFKEGKELPETSQANPIVATLASTAVGGLAYQALAKQCTETNLDDEIQLIDKSGESSDEDEKVVDKRIDIAPIQSDQSSSESSSSSSVSSDGEVEYKLNDYSEEPGDRRPRNLKLSIVEEESDDDVISSEDLNIAAPEPILRPLSKNKRRRAPLSPLSPTLPDCPPPPNQQRSSFYVVPDSPNSVVPGRPKSVFAQSPMSPTIYEAEEPAESTENIPHKIGQSRGVPVQSSSPASESPLSLQKNIVPSEISPIGQIAASPKRRPRDPPPLPPQMKSSHTVLEKEQLVEQFPIESNPKFAAQSEEPLLQTGQINEQYPQTEGFSKAREHDPKPIYIDSTRPESFIEPPIMPPSPTEDQQWQLEQLRRAKEESTNQTPPKPTGEDRKSVPLTFVRGVYRPTEVKFVPGQINPKPDMSSTMDEEYDLPIRSPRAYVESDSHVVSALWSSAMNTNPETVYVKKSEPQDKKTYEQFAQEDTDIMKTDERKGFFKFASLTRKSKAKSDDEGALTRGSKTDEEILSDTDREKSWDASKMSAFFKGRKRSKSKDRESELFDSNERSFGPEESSKKKSIFKFPTLRKKKDSKSEIQENVPVSPDGQPYGIEKTVMGSNVERSDTVKEAKRKAGFLSFLKRRSSDVVSPEREVKNFINERGQFVNERGILIDDRGRMINNRGQLINDLGQLINDQGQLINERGQLINDQGQLTNEQGQPIDEYGRLMTDQGRQLENYGRFTNNQGYQRNSRSRLIDNRGRLVNERGQLINELGQIIDEKGNILDPRIPENEPYTGEKGQLFNEKGQLVDSYGRLINERGQLIDGFGRPVNERGHLINNTGQLIDHNGRLINEKGQLINKKGQLINDKGQLVNEKGLLVDEKDRLINNRGQLINERGQFVNENGQLLNDYGQPVNDQGQLIDAYGEVLPVVTLLSDGDLKPISPKLRVKETDIDSDLHSSNISERPSSKNNEEQITPEKDIPAALYHKMLADTWSKTQPDPAQVRKIPKQMRGSTTSNQSSRLSENESVMNRNSDSLYDESHPSGIYRQNSGNQPGKSILRHHGRYEDGDIGMRHRPNRFESEGEADTEGFDESRGDLDPINSLPRRPLMPRRMGFPEKQPSRSHTNDTTPPVYIGDENQRPNEVDYTKFGLAAKLFADSIGPPPPIEKSKTMYMTMVNDIPEDVRWNRQSTSSEVFIPAKSRIPAEVLNAPRVELPEPDDNKLTPQWVIVRGRAVRRRKKKTRRGKTKIVTELDLAGRRIFFKVGSNWQDLAYSLFAQRQPEASTRRMIQEIRMKWSGYLPNQVQQMMRRWWKDRGQYATIEALKAGLDVSKIPYLMEQFEHDTGTTTCTDTETDGEELALSEMSDVDADVNRLIQEYEVKSLNSSFESGDFNLSVDNLLKPPSQRQSRNSSFFEESIITEGGTRISKPHFVIDKPQNAEYRHESTV